VSRRGPFTVPTVVVTVLAALAAGSCGSIAAVGYAGRIDSLLCLLLGILLGAGSGLVAGIFWCRMLRRTAAREGERAMVSAGAGYGIVAALMIAIVLHAGLAAVSLSPAGLRDSPIGFVGAIAVGAPLGAVCGFWLRWAARETVREARAAARTPTPPAAKEEVP
jgi:hypothetical protein